MPTSDSRIMRKKLSLRCHLCDNGPTLPYCRRRCAAPHTELEERNWFENHIMITRITNASDNFANVFHEYVSVWAVEKENKFLVGPKQLFFFSVFLLKMNS